ncbi:MAG: hypothetical protein IJK26_00140 [Clostridia bacterium]|nr:hypothetical protein [Clostridia bacterium]
MANNANTNNDEKSLWIIEKLRALKNLLIQFMFRNSINQKLEEMAEQLEQSIRNGEIMQEDLKDLSVTIDRLAGKLRNTSPDQMEQTCNEGLEIINQHIQMLQEKGRIVDAKVNEPDFFAAVKALSPKYAEMSDAEFKKHFNNNAVLYDNGKLKTKDDKTEGVTSMLIELDGECYQAEFNVGEINADTNKRDLKISVEKYNGSYNDAKEIPQYKEGESYDVMIRSFLSPRGLRREEDVRKYDIKKLAKENEAVYDLLVMNKYKDKIVPSADGRSEMTYDSKTNQFRIRDKETKKMIIVRTEQNNVVMDFAADTTDLLDKELASKTIRDEIKSNWIYDKAKGQIQYQNHFPDDEYSALFHTKELMEGITFYGINKADYLSSIEIQSTIDNTGFNKTNVEQIEKINRLERALKEVTKKFNDTEDRFIVVDSRRYGKNPSKASEKEKVVVYLAIKDKKTGYSFNYHFDEKGDPLTVSYRKENPEDKGKNKYKPKNKFAYNFVNFNLARDYEKVRMDEDFNMGLNLVKQARNLYQSREERIEKAKAPVIPTEYSDNVNYNFKDVSNEPIKDITANDLDGKLREAHSGNIQNYYINKFYNDVKAECTSSLLDGSTPQIDLNEKNYPPEFLADIAKVLGTKSNLPEKLNEFIAAHPNNAAEKLEEKLVKKLPRTDRGSYNRSKDVYESYKNSNNIVDTVITKQEVISSEPVQPQSVSAGEFFTLEDLKNPEKKPIVGDYKEPMAMENWREEKPETYEDYKKVLQALQESGREDVSLAYISRIIDKPLKSGDVTHINNLLMNAGVVEAGGFVNSEVLNDAYNVEINDNANNKNDIDDKE